MRPSVSIIIPSYQECNTIGLLLEAIYMQTHPLNDMEVVVADGMSDDGTRDVIQEFKRHHPELALRLVDNPDRIIPAALNKAINQAKGEVVIRLDAHSIPSNDYIDRCLETLKMTGAANVGGVWEIRSSGKGWIPRSIAVAAAHLLGAGDARYRTSGDAGEVDTVPFGAFRQEWLSRVGPFDESLLTNEDYEYNVRLRQAGGAVWFDPTIRSTYFARGDLISLARQYARYGYWKARMIRRYPDSLRLRQALPPLFVLTAVILGFVALFWRPAILLLGLQIGLYSLAVLIIGYVAAIKRRDIGLLAGFPLAIWTMHLAWGGAFLWSIMTMILTRRKD